MSGKVCCPGHLGESHTRVDVQESLSFRKGLSICGVAACEIGFEIIILHCFYELRFHQIMLFVAVGFFISYNVSPDGLGIIAFVVVSTL